MNADVLVTHHPPIFVREYPFELRLCAHLEAATDGIVSRQLGGGVIDPGRRILDIVLVEPGPEFDRRAAITAETIPPRAIHSEVGVGKARPWSVVTDLSPPVAERVRERAEHVGFFETVRRPGRDLVRQTVRYPDWFESITAIENKPSLGSPGDLESQLQFDVSLGLADRIVLATESYVTRAHLNRIPEAVGVWRVQHADDELSITSIREPTPLNTDGWGIEIGRDDPIRTRIEPVSPAQKRMARVAVAERAYGSGWRPAPVGCTEFTLGTISGTPALPSCTWNGQAIDPAACGPACPGFTAADPPSTAFDHERATRQPWVADPDGTETEQSAVTAFGSPSE